MSERAASATGRIGAWSPLAVLCVAMAALVACSGSAASVERTPRPTLPPSQTATKWDGERFDFSRTLPEDAIGSRQLTGAGQAIVDGETIAIFSVDGPGAAPWEVVSHAQNGWEVWQPDSVLAALDDAGPGATVASAEFELWSDACLGTHPRDGGCLQVMTPGYRVTVQTDGRRTVYHTDKRGQFVRLDSSE